MGQTNTEEAAVVSELSGVLILRSFPRMLLLPRASIRGRVKRDQYGDYIAALRGGAVRPRSRRANTINASPTSAIGMESNWPMVKPHSPK